MINFINTNQSFMIGDFNMRDPENFVKTICEQCGKNIDMYWMYYERRKHHFCDVKCYADYQRKSKVGEKNPAWKGGIFKGYHRLQNKGRKCNEHRIIMEKIIGRPLTDKEEVHHIDKNRRNNSPENLVLCKNKSEHIKKFHMDIIKKMNANSPRTKIRKLR